MAIESTGENDEVGEFFDQLSRDYTEAIERCFPRYREMLWALLYYLPDVPVETILELGCGTGNLTVLLPAAYPQSEIRAVDLSPDSIAQCSARLQQSTGVTRGDMQLQAADFRQLEVEDGSLDLVLSSIAIHHIGAAEKRELFGRIYRWLRPGGIFSYCDQCSGTREDVYAKHMQRWRQVSLESGGSEEEWSMWMDHQRAHDFHDPLPAQLQWLEQTGFANVDCTWRYLLWSVVQAQRPQ